MAKGNTLKVSFLPWQEKVFSDPCKRITVAKGRRLGFTRGAMAYVIMQALEGKAILWVDTTHSNVVRYFDRYAYAPLLRNISDSLYTYDKKLNELRFTNNGGYVDFRSAERAENIEGFGYDLVILNEAGIILRGIKGARLWENSISPMLLDNPNSRAIIGGVPKGMNFFATLAKRALRDNTWKHFTFSSYDNPLLKKSQIDQLVKEYGGEETDLARQEIFGEFLLTDETGMFGEALIDETIKYYISNGEEKPLMGADLEPLHIEWDYPIYVWGLDISRFGADNSVLIKRLGNQVIDIKEFSGKISTTVLCRLVADEFNNSNKKVDAIFVDGCGVGGGVVDGLQDLYNLPVIECDAGSQPNSKAYLNKRAEAYFLMKDRFKNMQIIYNKTLKQDLKMIHYEITEHGKLKLNSKKAMKDEYGRSPDISDALALTFYDKIAPNTGGDDIWEDYLYG